MPPAKDEQANGGGDKTESETEAKAKASGGERSAARAHRRPKLRPSWQAQERERRMAERRAYMASLAQVRRHVFFGPDVWESMLRHDRDGDAGRAGAAETKGPREMYPGGGSPTEDRTFEEFVEYLSWSSAC